MRYAGPCSLVVVDHEKRLTDHELITTGRGGAGNTRSPSKGAGAAAEATIRIEARYIEERESRKGEQIVRTHF